ncbi:hypothetical protein [Gandjariella thermophila]|uniref:Uncharacterized protein n=1 Tax=Gandjariella thermophila TaxID=1931992 RepID=A0A4D4J4S6_9PSEU|nr:hypothetical protein [Gandjariella thermophila]GDY29536.1 hypothetical protein GTS_11690 [Gandjariella thermophila]
MTTIFSRFLWSLAHHDAPTRPFVLGGRCPCVEGTHSYGVVSEEHFPQLTLRRYLCTCEGCTDCDARQVRVFPPAAEHGDPGGEAPVWTARPA